MERLNVDMFSYINFQPVKVNGKKRDCELISVQHKIKSRGGSSEIIIRVGLELMNSCGFTYGDSVFVEYGELGLERVIRITTTPAVANAKYPVTLSRQNKSKNSAGVIRITYKKGIGLPDFIDVESRVANAPVKRVKYLHENNAIHHTLGKVEFKLKLDHAS